MTKHRLGTIQSFRPGYGALMPQSTLYGKRVADFQRPEHGNIALKRHFEMAKHCVECHSKKWHGQQGSNLRPAVLETAALPTELCPYRAHVGAEGAS
jgi:hypothetical protein